MQARSLILVAAFAGMMPVIGLAHTSTAHLEGGFVDRDGRGDDDAGLRVSGAAAVASQAEVYGEVVDTGDYEQWTAGLGVHAPIQPGLEATAGGSLESVDTGRRGSDTGFGLRAGLRWSVPSSRVMVSPELRHLAVNDTSATSLRLGGMYFLSPAFQISGAVQGGDDDRFELGLRRSF